MKLKRTPQIKNSITGETKRTGFYLPKQNGKEHQEQKYKTVFTKTAYNNQLFRNMIMPPSGFPKIQTKKCTTFGK